jgi:hypothetical protein
MTDNEIIKAVICCTAFDCGNCPLKDIPDIEECERKCKEDALGLINRQKAEIERLKKEAVGISARTLKRFEKEIKDVQFTIGQTWEIQCALKDVLKEMAVNKDE